MTLAPPASRCHDQQACKWRRWFFFGLGLLVLECAWLLPLAVHDHTTWEIIMDSVIIGIVLPNMVSNWIEWHHQKSMARITRQTEALRAFLEELTDGQVADARPEG